jgi:hypothetical protein
MLLHYFNRSIVTVMIFVVLSFQSRAQGKWTKDMEVRIYYVGQMEPDKKTVIINATSGLYIRQILLSTDTVFFNLSNPELDDLLKKINACQFRDIVSGITVARTFDKPTISIRFIWDGQSHEVGTGEKEGIKKGDAAGFYKLYTEILSLAEKKTAKKNPN